jgi:hypothetical protein
MVQRIVAVAELEQQPTAAEPMRARARAGDEDSAWMVEQWEHGGVMPARVVLRACAEDQHGRQVSAERVIEGVWLERDDPPGVEQQVADVAPAALQALAEELRRQGVAVDDDELQRAFVHIDLDEALRGALR